VKKITVPLTDRPPVTFVAHDWPVLAKSSYDDYHGGADYQYTRRTRAELRVRQHADARSVVYGWYEYNSQWQGESDSYLRDGVLLGAGSGIASIVSAIREVGGRLSERSGEPFWDDLVAECIASLPAEEI